MKIEVVPLFPTQEAIAKWLRDHAEEVKRAINEAAKK